MADRTVDLRIRLVVDSKGAVTGIKTTKGETVKLGGAVDKTEKKTKKMGSTFGSMRMKVLGVAAAFTGVILGIKKVIKLAGEQEAAEKLLETALGRRSQALLDNAAALQQASAYGDENIIQVQATIAAFTEDEETIKRVTQATLDMAAATGMDLKAAGDLMSKTIGSSTNALARYGVEVTGTVGSQERLEMMTTNIANLWGGQAKAQAEVFTGTQAQMKNAIGDTAEALGFLLIPAIGKISKEIKVAAEVLTGWLSIPVSERLRDEQQEFNSLISILKDVNISQGTRNLAIEALQAKYSGYLGNLNLESASLKEIATAQEKANAQFVENIRLQAAKEMLIKQTERLAKAEEKLIEEEMELSRRRELAINLDERLKTAEFDINKVLKVQIEAVKNAREGVEGEDQAMSALQERLRSIGIDLGDVTGKTEEQTEATEEGTEAIKEQVKALGLIPPAWQQVEETEVQAAERHRMVMEARLEVVKVYMDAFKGVFQGLYDWRCQIIQNELNADIRAEQSSFNASKKLNKAKYTVEGKLTEEGLKKLAELEATHADTVTNLKEQARQDELKAKKKMVPVLVAEAIINTAVAVTKALPNIVLAILIGVAGALQVAKIVAEGAKIQGAYQAGGQFTVPGTGGPDSQTVILKATPREEFFAVPPGGWKPLPMPGGGGLASSAQLDKLARAVEQNTRAVARAQSRQVVEVVEPSLYEIVVDTIAPHLKEAAKLGQVDVMIKGVNDG